MIKLYTDKVKGAEKLKMTPVILINPKYRYDKGLHKHEETHVIQWFIFGILVGVPVFLLSNWFLGLLAGVMVHDLAYTLIRKYRQFAEVQAFRRQLKEGGSASKAAELLSTEYDLGITKQQALDLIGR